MKRMKLLVAAVLVTALGVGAFGAFAAHASGVRTANTGQAASGTCGSWSVVSSPNVNGGDTSLGAVAAVSSTDVWAVGNSDVKISSIASTVTEHWNGSTWSIVSSPNVGSFSNTLLGVAAVASNDVWAVGYYISSNHAAQTLIEHWNGSAWSVVSSPNASTSYNSLYAATPTSASDVWAAGYSRDMNGAFHTLIEHWNGSTWSIVSSPNPGTSNNMLFAIKAVGANNVYAAGQQANGSSPDQPLLEHWNGSTWTVVATASTSRSGVLYGVAGTANNVWAAGQVEGASAPSQTLVEQQNNSQWKVDSTPNATGASDTILYAITAASDSSAWAVGNDVNNNGNAQTVIEQWNGSQWSLVSSVSPGSGDNILGGVTAISANDVWAVGGYDNGKNTLTLTEHYC